MKYLRNIVLSGVIALVVMQLLPVMRVHNRVVIPSHTIEANLDVPASVEKILNNSCKDCHSNETRLPWYGKVAPLSWVIAGDVERARKAMNLSEWSTQNGAKPAVAMGTLMAACAGVEGQLMPPAGYLRMHPEARLDKTQRETLCGWTTAQARVIRKQKASRRTLAANRQIDQRN